MSDVSAELSEKEKAFDDVCKRAESLGVLDINFTPQKGMDSIKGYNAALDIVMRNKERYDRNAGETQEQS